MNRESTTNKKVPEVRMTKTARMRLLKANPLLKYQIEKTKNKEMAKNFNLDTVSTISKSLAAELEPSILASEKNIHDRRNEKESKNVHHVSKGKVKSKLNNNHPKMEVKTVRRSISAPRLRIDKKNPVITDTEDVEMINRSISVENLKTLPSEQSLFAYPSSQRKSILHSTPSASLELKRKLTDWLEKKQKSLSSFKHLKCFGVHKMTIVAEENKENFETSCINRAGSYELLNIDNPLHCDTNDLSLAFAPSDLEKVAEEAIMNLNCLISEGYPIEQCEAWLKVICNKCPKIVEKPQYWECRATIEQFRGDISSAVECYKTAVVQGAEVTSVEQSLDQLLKKFELLDIDSSTDQKKQSKERVKLMQDFKSVFTSMIIKFAIQEKTIRNSRKKKQSDNIDNSTLTTKVEITPVRRSTRLSRSLFTSTPGTKLCSSIQELNLDQKQEIVFKPNAYLFNA